MANKITSPKIQPQFSQMTMRQYWLRLNDTTVLAIYRDILKVSISRYFVINYRDTMLYITVIKNPFVMQY